MEQTNKIGFGILCFGDKKYFDGTVYKLNKLLDLGFSCYVLTDNPQFFNTKYTPFLLTTIEYKREFKSYHDKILLVKEILLNQDVAIILDADINYGIDFTPLKNLKKYNFKDGISYIENLSNHKIKKSTIKEMDLMLKNDWKMYYAFVNSKIGDFLDKETIWEHFLVFKKFDYGDFFKLYEKLQIIKEYCDVLENKKIIGAGEGITLNICSMVTGVPLQKDLVLYDKIKDLIIHE
jgi:hypothetical protein